MTAAPTPPAPAPNRTPFRRLRSGWMLAAACAAGGCATGQADDQVTRYEQSPQYRAEDRRFHNLPNPDAKPTQSAWRIWSRFFFSTKTGTVPVDAIPVQAVTRAQLDALPGDANHVIRLGHSSHLLKLQGRYWLIDPVFGERVSPFSFVGPKRFHPTPLKLEDLPPIAPLLPEVDAIDDV